MPIEKSASSHTLVLQTLLLPPACAVTPTFITTTGTSTTIASSFHFSFILPCVVNNASHKHLPGERENEESECERDGASE